MRNREADSYGLENKIQMLESENKLLRQSFKEQLGMLKMREKAKKWMNEAKELGDQYPDFDIESVADDPKFLQMLQFGIDMKHAYYALRHEEILDKMVKQAKEEASLKITDSIRAKGKRPEENGLTGKSTAVFKTDVSKLTPKQRAEIAKRVKRGETIKF